MSGKLIAGQIYAIDTVILIYLLERNPQYYQEVSQIFRKIESGGISAVLSTLVFTELLVPAYRAKDHRRANHIVHLLSNYPHLSVIPLNTEIAMLGAELRSRYKFRTPDAIHVATALQAKANGIITNDKDLQKLNSTDFQVILLSEP